MNWRVVKETAFGMAVIAAAMTLFLLLVSQADAAGRRAAPAEDIHAVPQVAIDEVTFIHITDELAQVRTELTNLQRQVNGAEATGIFRKPSNPDNPNTPQSPSQPPQFEFPSTPETEADPASIKDWSPEQWKSFFDTVLYLITAILGLFGGGAAGGLFVKKPA